VQTLYKSVSRMEGGTAREAAGAAMVVSSQAMGAINNYNNYYIHLE